MVLVGFEMEQLENISNNEFHEVELFMTLSTFSLSILNKI